MRLKDATAKKQKKRSVEDADAVDATTRKQKKRSIEDREVVDPVSPLPRSWVLI